MNNLEANYISLHEAAKLTNYSQDYISLLCRQKKLKGTKIGRNWVTTKEWIEDYVNRTKGNGQNVVPVKIKSATHKTIVGTGLKPVTTAKHENTPIGDSMPSGMGKLILTAIICSIFVSGFVFLQLGS
ncbi:MAG: helix-turn-helix domain-containing protein, partial [Candidatus Pacebacteria bacterium]|nr:helix-turn-helix domain-containing protein [Candidatus Paceibacterota bacterium]